MYCVYKHTTPSGKVYIGITRQDTSVRWKRGWGYNTNLVFFRAIQKYGWDNIKHEVLLEGLTEEEAKAAEIRLIAEHRSTEREYGYNITGGGDLAVPHRCSPQQKEDARRRWLGAGNPNARPVICLETLSIYNTAAEAQRETGASKISDCCHRTHKHRTSGGYHWAFYDSSLPMEHYEELLNQYVAEESAPRRMGDENKKKLVEISQRPVICLETSKVYRSIRMASKDTGASNSGICNCCKEKSNTSGGYHWAYYDGEKEPGHYMRLLNQRLSKKRRRRNLSKEQMERIAASRAKPVVCIETGVVYKSLAEAQRATGVGKSDICACCNGRQHTAGGYHWEHAEEATHG